MKYYSINITTNTIGTYQKVTKLLNVVPMDETIDFSMWNYQVVVNDEEERFDFVNVFIDLVEPNFERLKTLGIEKDDIIIGLVYEYDEQCSMEFNSQEMKRLGESGISFNIDCIRQKK